MFRPEAKAPGATAPSLGELARASRPPPRASQTGARAQRAFEQVRSLLLQTAGMLRLGEGAWALGAQMSSCH